MDGIWRELDKGDEHPRKILVRVVNMKDREEEIIREIEELKESDIPEKEKWERIIKLARELGRMALEKNDRI